MGVIEYWHCWNTFCPCNTQQIYYTTNKYNQLTEDSDTMPEAYTVLDEMTKLNFSFTNSSENHFTSTEIPEIISKASPSLGIAILSIAFIIGFPGNAFVIWTVLTRMKKLTVTCLLILHLAIADIMVILTAPFFLHLLATGSWTFGNIICKMCHYISCLSMYASIFLIAFMSVDRLLAVTRPLTSITTRTKSVVRKIIIAIWVLSSLLAIPMPIYRAELSISNQQQCRPLHSTPGHIIFQYAFETMTGFVIPFTIILSSYLCIGLRLRSAKFHIRNKTSQLVIMIIVIFSLSWLPYHVVNIMQVSGELSSSDKLRKAAKTARPNTTALVFLSSSINPILYAFVGSNFIRTAGVGFMARLFEGIGTDCKNSNKIPEELQQKNQDGPVELGNIHQ
ncbi:leukotriene B4 receptor 1-like isoform X2 [Pseudophryne corroboree]|uniref:leukotriene B4 receptor 1-like isoform X2 n=1 Tax=Pseudophryne corroboree TaxID=495146 RepID=UPI00308170CF